MFFWNSIAFSMIQQMLAISFLVPLPFLNPFLLLEYLEVLGSCNAEAQHVRPYQHGRRMQLSGGLNILQYCSSWKSCKRIDLLQSCGHYSTMKLLYFVLCPWMRSIVSQLIAYGNLNRICILLLCENGINLNYV